MSSRSNQRITFPRIAVGGFTLLEFQLAIAILALMTSVLFGVLTLGADAWRAVNRVGDSGEQRWLVQQFLRRQLQASATEWLRDQERQRQVSFVGENQWLAFVAPSPQAVGSQSLYWWTLSVSSNVSAEQEVEFGDSALVVGYRSFSELDALPVEPEFNDGGDERIELLEADIKDMRIEYLLQDADGRRWLDQWQEKKILPVAVRISLVKSQPSKAWPPLVVVLRQSGFSLARKSG